jgi:hypothetical protein
MLRLGDAKNPPRPALMLKWMGTVEVYIWIRQYPAHHPFHTYSVVCNSVCSISSNTIMSDYIPPKVYLNIDIVNEAHPISISFGETESTLF